MSRKPSLKMQRGVRPAPKQYIGHILNECKTAVTQSWFTTGKTPRSKTPCHVEKEESMGRRGSTLRTYPKDSTRRWGIIFIELTCPLESNATAAHKKKYDKYKFLAAALKPPYADVRL